MKKLKNWDNKTWLSSKSYISQFHKFLKRKINFNKNLKILDIGCGRANIISYLQRKYKFRNKAIGIDIIKNNDVKKNILFKKTDAIKYLRNSEKFDLIIIKQTIHFFSKSRLKILLNLLLEKLNYDGTLMIFSLKTKKNNIPCFKKMKKKLTLSLQKDERLLSLIKNKLKKSRETNFNYKVKITRLEYIKMIKKRYMSCLLNLSKKDLVNGVGEIKSNYNNQIKFTDTLKCITYQK